MCIRDSYYAWGDLDLNDVRYSKPEFKAFHAKDAKIYEQYKESPAKATGNDLSLIHI